VAEDDSIIGQSSHNIFELSNALVKFVKGTRRTAQALVYVRLMPVGIGKRSSFFPGHAHYQFMGKRGEFIQKRLYLRYTGMFIAKQLRGLLGSETNTALGASAKVSATHTACLYPRSVKGIALCSIVIPPALETLSPWRIK
jgi:hypothetical protein